MNGILLIDKEQDWTSNDVVAKLKGILHERRIGHSGTLDPMATGLLVVFVGRATRAVEFAEGHDKRYLASLRLGVTTDTQDTTGNVLKTGDASGVDEAALRAVLDRFTGEQLQTPPMYSAIKVNGRRLYDIARSGGEVERAPRPICVKSIEITGRDGDDWLLDISCSKGTYVRTLCNDIGDALGCGGCMSALRRTGAGAFTLDGAVKIGEVQRLGQSGRTPHPGGQAVQGNKKVYRFVRNREEDTLRKPCQDLAAGRRVQSILRRRGIPDARSCSARHNENGKKLFRGINNLWQKQNAR